MLEIILILVCLTMVGCTIAICRALNQKRRLNYIVRRNVWQKMWQKIQKWFSKRNAFVQSDKEHLQREDSVPIVDKAKATQLEQEANANLIMQGLDKVKCGQVQPFDNPRRPNATLGAPCKGPRPSARHEQNKPVLEALAALQEKQRMEEKSKKEQHETAHAMAYVDETTKTTRGRRKKNVATSVDVGQGNS